MHTKSRSLPSLLLLLSLGIGNNGCFKLGPEFTPPQPKVSDNWSQEIATSRDKIEYRQWWTVFQDPTLERLINLAYRQNLNLQATAIRIVESRAKLGIAKGNLFPQKQELSSSLFHNQHSGNEPNFTTFDRYYTSFDVGFDAIWEVDIWGKFRRGIESADAMLSVAELSYDDLLVSLTAEVAATYTEIRAFEQRLALARQNAELQNNSLKIAQAQYRNGLTTELDVQQARSLLHATRAQIVVLEVGYQQSKNALSVLLGMPPDQVSSVLQSNGRIPQAPLEVVVGIPADVIRRRPDVRKEELKAASQSAMIGMAKADLYPRLSLQGSIGTLAGSTQGIDAFDVFNAHAMAAKFGPTITWPILHYGRLQNNVRVQDARLQEQLAHYQQAVLQAAREVEDAIAGFSRTHQQIQELEHSVEASQRSVTIALNQYKQGIEDYQRVLNAQQFLVQQQDHLTVAQGTLARYLIALYKALGGGWQLREGQPLLPASVHKSMLERTDWGDILPDPEPVQMPVKLDQPPAGSAPTPTP